MQKILNLCIGNIRYIFYVKLMIYIIHYSKSRRLCFHLLRIEDGDNTERHANTKFFETMRKVPSILMKGLSRLFVSSNWILKILSTVSDLPDKD